MTSQRKPSNPMEQMLLEEIKSRLGTRVGRWTLNKVLGLGASAAVYRGHSDQTANVAIKILHSKYIHSAIVRKRFLREQEILQQIKHPNVLQIFSTDVTPQDEPYIVMELLVGMTLDKIMRKRKKPFSISEVYESIRPVLEVLITCHDRDIIHRDLKPANIFLTREKTIKLLDFGVARFHDDGVHLTRDGTALGTPAFMSPEQASGHLNRLDARSDVFSVGATMHYLLSNVYLHEGRTADETFIKAAATPAPSLARRAPEMNLEMVRLVDKAVAWDPDHRWQTAHEMLEQLNIAYRNIRDAQAAAKLKRATGQLPQVTRPALHTLSSPDASMAPWMDASQSPVRSTPDGVPQFNPQHNASAPAQPGANDEIKTLRHAFDAIDRMLETMLQYGITHSMAVQRASETFDYLRNAIERAPEQKLSWHVLPYSFEYKQQTIWEPDPPNDGIPYRLFTHGLRRFELNNKLNRREFDQLITLMLIDPEHDLAPEDDLASALWDLQLKGVDVQLMTTFLFSDRREQQTFQLDYAQRATSIEQDIMREVQSERERIKLLLSLGHDALAEAEALVVINPAKDSDNKPQMDWPEQLEENLLRLRRAHHRQRHTWLKRVEIVMQQMLRDMLKEGDIEGAKAPIKELIYRMLTGQRAVEALHIIDVVLHTLPLLNQQQQWLKSLMSPQTFELLLTQLGLYDPQIHDEPPLDDAGNEALLRLFPLLDGNYIRPLARGLPHFHIWPDLAQELDMWFRTQMVEHDSQLEDLFITSEEALAKSLFAKLQQHPHRAPHWAVRALTHEHPEVKVAGFQWLLAQEQHDLLQKHSNTIDALLWDTRAPVRIRALQAISRTKWRSYIPHWIQRTKDNRFHHLPEQERTLNFNLLHELSPVAAEQAAQELVKETGVVKGQAFQQTRLVAVHWLGKHGAMPPSRDALLNAQKRRPWNPKDLQEAAKAALEAFELRRRGPK